jgi:hypothetical protein
VTAGDHDNIHLHGYDILLHTGPGLPPARFEFTATTPGSFEIEQEEAGKQIAELNVTPGGPSPTGSAASRTCRFRSGSSSTAPASS